MVINDELNEHHTGAGGALLQLIKINQESKKSMSMAEEKAYLPGWVWYAALLEIDFSASLNCELVLMTLLPIIWLICSLERSIYAVVSMTQQRAEAVQH